MVGIRRAAPRMRGLGKSSSRSSSRSLMGYAPLCLVGLAALYGIKMLMTFSGTSNGGSIRGGNNDGPMGVAEALHKSHVRLPKKEVTPAKDLADLAPVKQVAQQQQQQPPPIQKYDHHLEESDIHMLHPDSPAGNGPDVPRKTAQVELGADGSRGAPIHHIVLDKKGTGATNVAYVQDFHTEKGDLAFRRLPLRINGSAARVATLLHEFKVIGCKSLEKIDATSGHSRWTVESACLDPKTPQIAYNSASFPRIWCGQEIAPQAAVHMSEHCTDPTVHLFPVETPPVNGKDMPPIILKSNPEPVEDLATLKTVDCDITCLQEPGMEITENEDERYFENEPWILTQTLADSYNTYYSRIERTSYRKNRYYSTQSFKSSIPLTFYDPEKFSLRNRPAISYESAKPKAVYMISGMCAAPATRRNKYFEALSKVFPVDSMGDCQHNMNVPPGMTIDTMEGRIQIMQQYRFVLAFEKTTEKDNISPIVWEALISGAVPVVVGADNLRMHLPLHSYIDSGAYDGWDEVAIAIKEINDSKEKWESYHAWRNDEAALAKFESLYEFSKTSPFCRSCRWAYAKRYGLGWDHAKQKVTETHISRSLCTTSSKGLASKPFQEEWISRNDEDEIMVNLGEDPGTETCSQPKVDSTIDNGSTYKIQRSLINHDGVVDILVTDIERESTRQELVLRLHFPGLHNSDGAHFENSHTAVQGLGHSPLVSSASMQDDFSKVTVVADWVTSVSCPREGVLEVVIVEQHENEEQPSKPLWPNIPRRIRVITEDMNVIHDKTTEYFPSTFADKMIRDFVDPLEVYFVDA